MKNVLFSIAILLIIAGCCEEKDDVLSPNYTFILELPSYGYADNCFFIQDPELIFQTFTEEEVISHDLPPFWINNAVKFNNDNGRWIYKIENLSMTPDLETLRVFIDDGKGNNNIGTVEGFEIDHPETTYQFNECVLDLDFDFRNNMLIFQFDINGNDAIGISYTSAGGDVIGNPNSIPIEVKLLRRPYQTPENDPDTWLLYAKNCYSYGDIYPETWTNIFIGYKDHISEELNTNIPEDLQTGCSLNTFLDFFRLDTNFDYLANINDPIFFLENHLIVFPFIRPFESVETENFYQSNNIDVGECKYYVRMESLYPDNSNLIIP